MSLAVVYSRATVGIEAPLVTVEVHLSSGLPCFTLVGLPETVVKESRERVRSAILHCGLDFPQQRITINLAPADLPKAGGRFDLAIAIGILAASGQLGKLQRLPLDRCEFMGELSLAGDLRRVQGVLPGLLAASRSGRDCIVPQANGHEAALLESEHILLGTHLLPVLAWLQGQGQLEPPQRGATESPDDSSSGDFADVIGQAGAKRALLIAAAGGHNLLMLGPPGTGKTMLASRLPSILPPLSINEALELAALQSIAGQQPRAETLYQPPFRAPHHSSSPIALTGGGAALRPGEISLAHHGVLFLDELPEFQQQVLDMLREPLEAGCVHLSRARYRIRLPARFQLIAAMNPCPCGYHGDPERDCRCTPDHVRRYQQRVSGPLLDRIDLQVCVPRLSAPERDELLQKAAATQPGASDSASMRQLVIACRARQLARAGCDNAGLGQRELRQHCELSAADTRLLSDAIARLQLSARATFRILKVARTIADLDAAERIDNRHLLEAINYRRFDAI